MSRRPKRDRRTLLTGTASLVTDSFGCDCVTLRLRGQTKGKNWHTVEIDVDQWWLAKLVRDSRKALRRAGPGRGQSEASPRRRVHEGRCGVTAPHEGDEARTLAARLVHREAPPAPVPTRLPAGLTESELFDGYAKKPARAEEAAA